VKKRAKWECPFWRRVSKNDESLFLSLPPTRELSKRKLSLTTDEAEKTNRLEASSPSYSTFDEKDDLG
jgi:hypothetical protein